MSILLVRRRFARNNFPVYLVVTTLLLTAMAAHNFDVKASEHNGRRWSEKASDANELIGYALGIDNETFSLKKVSPFTTGSISGRVFSGDGLGVKNAVVRARTSSGFVKTSISSAFGFYRFDNLPTPDTYTITVSSKADRFFTKVITLTADVTNVDFFGQDNPIFFVNAGADQTITLPSAAQFNASSGGGSGSPVVLWSKVSGPGTVTFGSSASLMTTANFSVEGVYILRVAVTDAPRFTSDDVQITVNSNEIPPPPDPVSLAPVLDPTVATDLATATQFLYTGPGAIQTGVNADMIEPERVGLIRGRVLDRSEQPIINVNISILDHPELGQTRSRADGKFDMVVNAGGKLTVKYEKAGYISSQRDEVVDWQTYSMFDDLVMISYDPNVTAIDLNAANPIQVASGGMSDDSSGQRRSRLFFKQGTTAAFVMPDNSSQPASSLHVRATEFTTGESGPEAMPGGLPPMSGYTYAVEYSVDEAVAAHAKNVVFSQPVIQYNENFLNFPVGIDIPSGSFNRETGIWESSITGRVVKVLSITGGIANLDLNGSGNAADAAAYAAIGMNDAERQQLAATYSANQILWRVPLLHFSPWDSNWPFGPPADAKPPQAPSVKPKKCECPDEEEGSIINVQNQTLIEEVDVPGTPFYLRYDSDRQKGYDNDNTLQIQLSTATPPVSLKRIELEINVGGRLFSQNFTSLPSQNTTFVWDGKDAFNRPMQGAQPTKVRIGYVYDGVYQQTGTFGYNGNGTPISGDKTRQEVTLNQIQNVDLSKVSVPITDLGGWTLDEHHIYDPTGQVLYEGNGDTRGVSGVIDRTAGTKIGTGYTGDGGPANNARLSSPSGLASAPDGSLYLLDQAGSRIRHITPDGIINTIAGNGQFGDGGDGVPATQAALRASNIKIAADGSMYVGSFSDFNGNAVVRRIGTDGIIRTVAGGGNDFSGEGIPAKQANLRGSITYPAPDGTFYIIVPGRAIRRVGTDGIIRTVAGNLTSNNTDLSDGAVALNARIDPTDLAGAPNGDLYFTDGGFASAQVPHRIRRLSTDGHIYTVAGGGSITSDGIQATDAKLDLAISTLGVSDRNLAFASDGTFYFFDGSASQGAGGSTGPRRLRAVSPQGVIYTVAGNGIFGSAGDGGAPTSANIGDVDGITVAPNGSVYFVDKFFSFAPNAPQQAARVRVVASSLPPYTANISKIASTDGDQLYVFDPSGRHLRTINTLTGATALEFGYTAQGLLTTITDGDNNLTTVNRDTNGNPLSIVGPYGQITNLSLNVDGYIAAITNANQEAYRFTYDAGGLVTSDKDPRNNERQYTYGSGGRFIRDNDPANGVKTLTRTASGQSYNIELATAESRVSEFDTQNLISGDQKMINTDAAGLISTLLVGRNDVNIFDTRDGMHSVTTFGPDPRWMSQAPIEAKESVATPANLINNLTLSRSVSLSDPNDPLSLISQTDTSKINGRNFTTFFDADSKTFTEQTPLFRQISTTIDAQGRSTRSQVANFNPVDFIYDARGRLSTTTSGSEADARTSHFAYNSGGFLSLFTNSLNQPTAFGYDNLGRLTQQTSPDNTATAFGYDANGNLTSITPPGRPAHSFTFNEVDRLASYTAPNVGGSSTTSYTYNRDRDLTRITLPDNQQLNYTYDSSGHVKTLVIPNGSYTYNYDAATAQLASTAAPGGDVVALQYDGSLLTRQTWTGAVTGNVGHTYDNNFRIASENINGANGITYSYDNDDLLTGAGAMALTRDGQNGLITSTVLNGVADTLTYSDFAEISNYHAAFNAATLYNADYSYDKLGRITQKLETIGGVPTMYSYGYDTVGRLQTVTLDGAAVPIVTYTYDPNDNRKTINVGGNTTNATYDAQDRLTQYGTATYAYTANGDLKSKTNGSSTTQFIYDVVGNLRSVTLPDGRQITYVIDGQDRRIGKRVNGTLTQGFLYRDQLAPVAELDGTGAMIGRFVYGSRTNVPDYMIKGGKTYRLITDFVGSVRLVVDTGGGSIAQRIDYDEFGLVLQDTNPGFQPFGFAGGIYDRDTGLTRFGERDYEAGTGRWTAKDPILYDGGSTNLYSYAGGDPLNFIDPSGKAEFFAQIDIGPVELKYSQKPGGPPTFTSELKSQVKIGPVTIGVKEEASVSVPTGKPGRTMLRATITKYVKRQPKKRCRPRRIQQRRQPTTKNKGSR